MDIQKRFDRILSVYFHLQSKKAIKVQELADIYGVSVRTIYRDLGTLERIGIPLYAEPGSGYALIPDFHIPPTLFSKEEALSFVAAEKLMQKYYDKDLSRHFSEALLKMKSVLRYTDKEDIDILENQILTINKSSLFNEKIPSALSDILKSITQKKQILIAYKKPSQEYIEERLLEPIGLFHENDFWYIMAYCHLRQDYRQFRLDRFQKIHLKSTPFKKSHPDLNAFLDNKKIVKKQKIVLEIDKEVAKYLEWSRVYHGFVSEVVKESTVEMTFELSDFNQGFARWYLLFADSAQILEPKELIIRVRELLSAAQDRISANSQS